MKKKIDVSVFEAVGSPFCVSCDDGEKIHKRLAAILEKEGEAVLSFCNVTTLTFAFLNSAVGQLYGEFSEKTIRQSLKVKDMEADDLALLKRVVDTAKQYFKDPRKFNQAIRESQE